MANNTIGRDIALGLGAVVLTGFIGSWVASPAIPVLNEKPRGLSIAQQSKLEEAAAASLFGQFRSSMADFLYLKVDKYTHGGVEMRGKTEIEKKQEATGVHSAEGEEGYRGHDGEETTVVPAKRDDWRGIIGDIERETQPFEDMSAHKHRDPSEALPLFRLMTLSNPQFITGYVIGSSMIARDKARYAEALAFLREGERNNPVSLEIKTELGMFYTVKLHDYEKAEVPVKEALAIAAQRDSESLTDDEKEAWQNAFRYLVLSYRYRGMRAEAHAAAAAGLKAFPGDVVCKSQLQIERDGTWEKFVDKRK